MPGRSRAHDGATPVVVIAGPTASGKSRLAVEIAEAFDGVVINADSMQIYKELAILTARPTAADMARVPHRLYGAMSGLTRCSAGLWRSMALPEISACHAAGQLPILTGGTGLYLRALEAGLADVPGVPEAVRIAAEARHDALGGPAFHADLAARDPVMAERLRPSDRQRLVRAWSVFEATGRSLADWQGAARPPAHAAAPYRFLHLICLPARSALYAACNARVQAMVAAGAVEEVRALLALRLDPTLPVMKALGVAALGRHLSGELSRDAAVALMQRQTRNFAKRQMTWMRTQLLPRHPDAAILNEQYSESLRDEIYKIIRQFLLTGPR